jgi:DNA ligase (NAD+)
VNKIDRIKELVELLNYHRDLYYNKSRSEISDLSYDKLFDELSGLEKETGFILASSPTQTVGYEVKSSLNKVTHNHPMLSLDKTKSVDDVIKFLDGRDGVIMAKMDGLTCSLRYLNGELVSAETRGNGEVGEDILHCAKTIKNLPLKIDCMDEVIVDGEVIITYDDFNKINETLPEGQRYKNPRNLASGSIRQLDSSVAAQRNMKFIAWKLINGYDTNSFFESLVWMENIGFTVVPVRVAPCDLQSVYDIECYIEYVKQWAKDDSYPIDGCVIGYNDITYGDSLGATGHHLRSQLAFKFYDEVYETKLLDIDWTLGRTGQITPTAVFEPVEIDGTTVERASVHNVSILTKLDLHVGDTIEVFKANMIVPQVQRNVSADERNAIGQEPDYIAIPRYCPVCEAYTKLVKENDTTVLMCTNPDCSGKLLGRFTHFVSKKGMNIDGLSSATIELLISKGYLKEFKDIYALSTHSKELAQLPGLGAKSVEKLLQSIEKSREVKLENFICALGIPNIGLTASKTIAKYCNGDVYAWFNAFFNNVDWTMLDDFGGVMAQNIEDYLRSHVADVENLADEMNFIVPEAQQVIDNPFTGKTLVVTGKLNHFTRDSINEKIASLGAKTAGSVSKKTDYLITNEQSGSSKYKKAVELNIPIITEEEFMNMIGE